MPAYALTTRLQHAWNAFVQPSQVSYYEYGRTTSYRPDRTAIRCSNERSMIMSVYNQIAIDVASLPLHHVRLDQNGRYEESISSGLEYVLNTEANLDQTARNLIQDIVLSMFDEGCVAVVPTDTTTNPRSSGAFDIQKLRTGKIVDWMPEHVRVRVYNERTGLKEDLVLPKRMVAIIENPLYAVMNEPNGTYQRLIRKLNILDAIDEQSGSGKLDIIIQLPYPVKTPAKKAEAEQRRKDIEFQLAGSRYGIAYADATEKITQLNRPAENNLMTQIQYLTSMLYGQLGVTEEVAKGTADEKAMVNYNNRTVIPVRTAIVDEFKRKFLTRTARTQNQSIMYFRDVFANMTADNLADASDKFTRNEILSPNEVRSAIGYKPSKDPKSDELRNRNLNDTTPETRTGTPTDIKSPKGDIDNEERQD